VKHNIWQSSLEFIRDLDIIYLMNNLKVSTLLLFYFLVSSCITEKKTQDTSNEIKIEEFENVVKVEEIKISTEEPTNNNESSTLKKDKSKTSIKKSNIDKIKSNKNVQETSGIQKSKKEIESKQKVENNNELEKTQAKTEKKVNSKKRLPEIEDDEGFDGRRPIVLPFQVGEEIILGLSYFGVEAGKFTMQVLPIVQVNGHKSYHFRYIIKSSPLFSMFYSVDDIAETFVDYENLIPYSYEIHVKETKQVRETRTYFDLKNGKATLWDKKVKIDDKPVTTENTKMEWDLLAYPQNVFSAAYYLRNFTLKIGKKLKINVGHEGKNIVMTAEVIRKEKIYTKLGAFNTFVVKPSFDVDGKFKPTGENYLWLTADDKKFIVRLESKIKIGSIVGEVQKISK
jgi:hypothetical protein